MRRRLPLAFGWSEPRSSPSAEPRSLSPGADVGFRLTAPVSRLSYNYAHLPAVAGRAPSRHNGCIFDIVPRPPPLRGPNRSDSLNYNNFGPIESQTPCNLSRT